MGCVLQYTKYNHENAFLDETLVLRVRVLNTTLTKIFPVM